MSRLCLTVVAVCLFSIGGVIASGDDDLIVTLNHGGSLAGINLVSTESRNIRSFLGIPYAKPPIGTLRFESPVPFPSWVGIRNAKEDGNSCPQSFPLAPDQTVHGNEDCLYVNVYTPPLSRIPEGGLSVMVWVHGGACLGGSNNHLFYGPDYILNHDVVLVAVNYRVGPLGFLSTETLDCPGNFGLKDQVEALRWVKQHISSFGGNPDSVTVFGESAGGASISYLLQSEKPRGLFHRAIPQSGTVFNSWAQPLHKGVAQGRAFKMAKLFDCDNDEEDWRKMISCLKQVDAIEMTGKTGQFTEWNGYPYFVYQPVIEPVSSEAFLVERPRDVPLNSLDIPILTGVTSGEGILSTAALLSNEDFLKEVKTDFENKFPLMLSYDHWDKKKQKEMTKAFLGFYLKNGHDYHKLNHQNFTDMFSDSLFVAGFDEYLEKRLSGKAAPTPRRKITSFSANEIQKF
ncbi:CES5A.2 family protein [Megaselia abdita]